MASLHVYYKNGNYEEFSPTTLPFGDGYLIQNDFIKVDNIEDEGIVWERSFFATESDDPDGVGGTIRQFQLVKPEDLLKIELIMLNNTQQIYPLNPQTEDSKEIELKSDDDVKTSTSPSPTSEISEEETSDDDTEIQEDPTPTTNNDDIPHDNIDENDLEELFANLDEEAE